MTAGSERDRSVARILSDAASTLSSCDDAAMRLRGVLELVAELVPCQAATLHLADPQVSLAGVSVGEGAGEAYRQLAAALFARLGDDREYSSGLIKNGHEHAQIAFPLVSRDMDLLGLLLLCRPNERPYGEEDLQRLTVAGSLISSYLSWLETRQEHAALIERERAARERAEIASRAKDTFLANLSHELRTPLNAIAGWASLLRKGALNEATTRRAIEVIDRSAKAEAQLIDDVLDVSRIISGKLRMDMHRMDLAATVANVVETVLPTAEVKGITVSVQTEPPVMVMADAARLHQVLWNLISNAVKFTPKGGCIDVLARSSDTHVEVEVRDTGVGLSPEFLPYLFERFTQADDSQRRQNPGLGLGLAIVRHIVEAHGGTVEAESPGENLGSTFRVRLPAVQRREESKAAGPTGIAADDRLLPAGVAGTRVLVVDDDPDAREVVQWTLAERAVIVRTASSAEEASAIMRSATFDLLLVDIGMPAEDGHAFLRRLRAEGCPTPAIALTAYGRPDDKRVAAESGFARHVTKPVSPDNLVAAMLHALGRE
jgi:signal transduction histidine kinase